MAEDYQATFGFAKECHVGKCVHDESVIRSNYHSGAIGNQRENSSNQNDYWYDNQPTPLLRRNLISRHTSPKNKAYHLVIVMFVI